MNAKRSAKRNYGKGVSLLKLEHRSHCCSIPVKETIQLGKNKNLSRLIEKYLRSIFDQRTVPKELQQKLLDYYYKKLGKAVDIGYKPNVKHYDATLAHSLKRNIAKFSAFKEVSFRNSLLEILEKKGTLPTWNEFRDKALNNSKLYNVNWLKTEYHQTVATANMARKWQDFERTKDIYPNLKYVTVGDDRVRDKHKKWDGFIAPINHPIWKKLLPPNDWGCRCDVIATDEKPTKGYETFDAIVKKGFDNNPALSGAIFSNNPYEVVLGALSKKEARVNLATYLQNSKGIVKTKFPKLKIELGADLSDLKRNYEVAAVITKQLDIEILIRKHIEKKNYSNPEYLIKGKYLADRKSIEKENGIIWGIDNAKKQMMNPLVNPTKTPYYIVWDLDVIKNLDIDVVIRNIVRKVSKTRGTKIKGMLFYYNGKAVHLSRTEIVNRKFEELFDLK